MKQTLVVALLTLALALGLFADLAVRGTSTGLSLFLWICGLVLSIVFLHQIAKIDLVHEWKTMAVVAVALGATFLWRASAALTAVALLGTGAVFILMTLRGAKPSLAECGLLEYCHAAVVSTAHATAGLPLLLFSDLRWEEITAGRRPVRIAEVARGLAITAPVILVLGSLFVGADAVFQKIVFSLFDFDLAELIGHLFVTGVIAWVVAGFLRGGFVARPTPFPYARTKPLGLGVTEVGIVLGSSILLFTLFLVVQFRYLFGGADLIQVTPSLTYAEYARRGFFELTVVVALVLPMLLFLEWALKKDSPAHVRFFRALATVQVVLLGAVIASAVQRMLLYQQEYGLTELRVYTSAFMGWMALLLVWYVATVLTGRRVRFAIGAIGAAFLTHLVLLAANPDDLIARTNIARAAEGKRMDAKYLTVLSNDAVPALVNGLHVLDQTSQRAVARNLLKRKDHLAAGDWRSWNWSSYAALQALAGHEGELCTAAE